jgi:hypothetical protein
MKRFSAAQMAEIKRVLADVTLVGKHLFGRDWIGELTEEEQALFAKYGPRPGKYGGGTIIDPCPANMVSRLDRALGREQRILHQRGAAAEWLHDHGLLHVGGCDPAMLASALAKQPPAGEASTVLKVGRPRRFEAIAIRMKMDLATGRRTEQELIKAYGKNLQGWYGADIKTCKKAIEMVLSGAL